MSFATYLHENRDQLIDHRHDGEHRPPGIEIDPEHDVGALGERPAGGRDGGGGLASLTSALGARRRSARGRAEARARYQPVRPFFTPSVYAQPLPYLDPWERR